MIDPDSMDVKQDTHRRMNYQVAVFISFQAPTHRSTRANPSKPGGGNKSGTAL